MTRCVLTIVAIFININLISQSCEVEVNVSYEGGDPCSFCTVQLTKLDSLSLIDFKYTDSLGIAKFDKVTSNEEVLLRASQFGYQDSIVRVSCYSDSKIEIRLTLHPLSVHLNEMTILDKIALLKKNGDTTTFNLKNIESGFEISTFDIVQRFPGIEISGNKISYHGKPLNEILISDIDISFYFLQGN